jgi:hypothetical protein
MRRSATPNVSMDPLTSTLAAVAASAMPGTATEPASENSTLPTSFVVPEKTGAAALGRRPEI